MERVLYCLSSRGGLPLPVLVCPLNSRSAPLGPIRTKTALFTFVDADPHHEGMTTPQRSHTASVVLLADQYLDGNVQNLRRTLDKG